MWYRYAIMKACSKRRQEPPKFPEYFYWTELTGVCPVGVLLCGAPVCMCFSVFPCFSACMPLCLLGYVPAYSQCACLPA